MLRNGRKGVIDEELEDIGTQVLPPSPLFPPRQDMYPTEPTGRRAVIVVLLAVLVSLVVAAVAVGAFVVYDGQADRIADLRTEGNQLRSESKDLTAQLAKSQKAAASSNAKLGVASKNLRKARADVAAAKTAATAQYGVGFSAGTSSGYSAGADDSYNNGWSVGYDVGYDRAYAFCESVTYC